MFRLPYSVLAALLGVVFMLFSGLGVRANSEPCDIVFVAALGVGMCVWAVIEAARGN